MILARDSETPNTTRGYILNVRQLNEHEGLRVRSLYTRAAESFVGRVLLGNGDVFCDKILRGFRWRENDRTLGS